MKQGWTYKKLGEIAVSMADGPFGSNLKKEHYTNKREVRIIQLSNIGEDGWREDNQKYTTFEHLKTIQRSEVTPGDIVIAKMMPAGRAIICPNNESKFVLSSDAVRVALNNDLDNKFICYSINSSFFRKQVYENVTGSGRVRTSLTKLRDCKIGVPSLSEQQRIVERLDAAFAHIDELKEKAEKQLSEARALFQRALTKAMEPKEGWEEKKMKDVCRIERGGSPRPIKDFITNDSNGLNWIKIGDTDPQGKYIYSTKEKIKPEGLRKSRWVEEDEFLLSNSMSFGRPYILKTNGCIHDGWLVLRDYQKNLFIDFFYYMLLSSNVQKQFKFKAQGSTVSNLNTDRVADVNISYPSLSEQQRIVSRLDSLSENVRKYEEIQRKIVSECDALKQALLRKVFE